MSMPSGVSIVGACITAVNELRSGRGANKIKFIIYKISDDLQTVVVEESSSKQDYEVFLQRLSSAVDSKGEPAPRYAVYDVEYDLGGEGKRTRTIFIAWVPDNADIRLRTIYASTKEYVKKALNLNLSIHADNLDEIDWRVVLKEASSGKA
ncbi:cofilin, actophorin [Tricladium varicosporioides]|nr:cofilin, actophorin [Hymenoscyphus varicosporioides]